MRADPGVEELLRPCSSTGSASAALQAPPLLLYRLRPCCSTGSAPAALQAPPLTWMFRHVPVGLVLCLLLGLNVSAVVNIDQWLPTASGFLFQGSGLITGGRLQAAKFHDVARSLWDHLPPEDEDSATVRFPRRRLSSRGNPSLPSNWKQQESYEDVLDLSPAAVKT
ncbi:unnamed protein product [Pleuronectes platessa]|uniref:Uncharacterized protein n=1 Tax=Pleuronectes platessa TaxID=8262 RepID=A0A9N7YGA8_PLEPL|nr:unnamed protein product [Pleuronectes platessa]